MASFGDPRYGISFSIKDDENNSNSKTINYVNLKIGGTSSGYSADQVSTFAEAVESLTGGNLTNVAVTAQFPLNR